MFGECQKWCDLNVITYSALISAYLVCGEWKRPLSAFADCRRWCTRQLITCTALMFGLTKAEQ